MNLHILRLGALGTGFAYTYYQKKRRPEVFLEVKRKLEVEGPPIQSSAVTNLVFEVATDLKLDKLFKSKIKPFITSTIDAIHLGSPKIDECVFLGIPQYFFLFDNVNQVPVSVSVNNKILRPEEANSYFLSVDAKKFALASELLKSERIPYSLVYFITVFSLGQGTVISFLVSLMLYRKKLRVSRPLTFHSIIYILSFVFWAFFGSLLSGREELIIDSNLASISESYRKGGLEYYSKIKDVYDSVLKTNVENSNVNNHRVSSWFPFVLTVDQRIERLKKFDRENNSFFF